MLQGSLENFALDEVLGLLSSTAKTGQLDITGDRGTGALTFRDGRLVGGSASFTANGTEIEDVMFELLRYGEGNFTFTASDVQASDFDENVITVLETAESRLQDWRDIEAVVPSLDHIVNPAEDLPEEEVTITRAEWSALTTIGAGCPAATVCERLDLGEVEGSRQIKNLAERDLVVITKPTGVGRGRDVSHDRGADSPVGDRRTPPKALVGSDPLTGADTDSGPDIEADSDGLNRVGSPVAEDSGGDLDRPPMPPTPPTESPVMAAPSASTALDDVPPPPPFEPIPIEDAPDPATDPFGESPPVPPVRLENIAPPSPSEISEFGESLSDASELLDEPKDGGLLMQYIQGDD